MSIKIHGIPFSTCTARVLATLYEKNVEDFEIVPVDLMKGEHKAPEFLKLQPFGQIPTLTIGDLTIFESRAISRMIAHKFEGQGTPLYGTTPKDKALVETWLEVEGQNFNGPISATVFQAVFAPMFGKTTDVDVLNAQFAKLGTVLDVYEKHLTSSKYLAGDFFSLADLSHLPYMHYLVHAAKKTEIFDNRPAVKAWWDDISSRPSWVKWMTLVTPKA